MPLGSFFCIHPATHISQAVEQSVPVTAFKLAHLSDTHVGFRQYSARATGGVNQREADVARVFHRAVGDIDAWDPPLVVHSGDVAEGPSPSKQQVLFIKQQLTRLAARRPDGSRRQVVVIAGNHDADSRLNEPCHLEYWADVLDGVHVVTDRVAVIDFTALAVDNPDIPRELAGVAVTAVPHDTLEDLAAAGLFDTVVPQPERINVLTTHGIAGGSELHRRALGKEFAIPTEVLGRDWDYVALGHWHRQGPVRPGGGYPDADTGRIWYAGSLESLGFGDLRDNRRDRGWLQVQVRLGEMPEVTCSPVVGRPMFRLSSIDAEGKSADELTAELTSQAAAAHDAGTTGDAVVEQVVLNVRPDIWQLVDTRQAKTILADTLHFQITPKFLSAAEQTADSAGESPSEPVPTDRYRHMIISEIAPDVLNGAPDPTAEAAIQRSLDLLDDQLRIVDPDAPAVPTDPPAPSTASTDHTGEAA